MDVLDNQTQASQQKFSFKRVGKVLAIVLAIMATAGLVYAAVISRPVRIWWASFVHANREVYMDCQTLPFYSEVQKAAIRHQDIITRVLAAGAATDTPEEIKCPAFDGRSYFIKGELLVTYRGRGQL